MFLTRWIMASVLVLPVWSAVTVIQPYRVVSINGTAKVQCFIQPRPSYSQIQSHPADVQTLPYPYPIPEELRVSLLKGLYGSQELCSSVVNVGEQKEAEETEGEVRCSAQLRDASVEVTVSGLKAADTDIYRCDIEVFYPPPYLQLAGNGTLIHVVDGSDCPASGAQRQISHREDDEDEETIAPVSILVVVLVILVMFVLLIIIFIQVLQCKQGRRELVRLGPAGLHKGDDAAFSC